MRSFKFWLTLIALVSSIAEIPTRPAFPNIDERNEDTYGCVIPKEAFKCCWVHPHSCCAPNNREDCVYDVGKHTCCKIKSSPKDGKNTYLYTPGKKIFS